MGALVPGRAAGNAVVCSTLLQNAVLTREKTEPEQKSLTKPTLPVRLWEPGRLVTGKNASEGATPAALGSTRCQR